MKFRPESACKFCPKLFCCLECRIKHEIKLHFSLFCEAVICDLCNGQERVVLKQENTNAFVDHLFTFHLPLQCRNCSVVFHNKADLTTVHKCVSSEKVENEKSNSKMAFSGEGKIEPIIEEVEQGILQTDSKPHEGSMAENRSLTRNGSSINHSDNAANQTPPITLVRQTSTPMTKLLHEIKRRSYDSMSASSIQMSSIENCSSENDISPPIPPVTSNLNVFKQPSRRMPVGATPYRQIMSRSIQRAFSSQGISSVRNANVTPPLDLRTSPVIRRTISMEGNGKPRTVGIRKDSDMIDLRTTPVIRRTRHIEAKNLAQAMNVRHDRLFSTFNESEQNKTDNENSKMSPQESPQTSSLSRSKSSNTLFETCRSFDSSVSSSNQISETPKSSGLPNRSSSFSTRQRMKMPEENKEEWLSPKQDDTENMQDGFVKKFVDSVDPSKLADKNGVKEELMDKGEIRDANFDNQPSKGILWSLFSSVLRFTSSGGTATDNFPSNDNHSLIKRCASFTGILPKKPLIKLNEDNPNKRRRTTTASEVESYSPLENDGNNSGKRNQRIYGRPPIERMRQS